MAALAIGLGGAVGELWVQMVAAIVGDGTVWSVRLPPLSEK